MQLRWPSRRPVGDRPRDRRPDRAKSKTTQSAVLPKRTLGRTGVEVSMLNLGTWRSVGLDRILRFAWANGIRYIDTAKSYGSEPAIGRWLQAMPEVRKELFLVTKDHPQTPRELIKQLDERLDDTQDRLRRSDLHPRRGRPRLRDRDANGPRARSSRRPPRRSASRARHGSSGFRPTTRTEPQILQAAADGGFVDVDHAPEQPLDRRGIGRKMKSTRAR